MGDMGIMAGRLWQVGQLAAHCWSSAREALTAHLPSRGGAASVKRASRWGGDYKNLCRGAGSHGA